MTLDGSLTYKQLIVETKAKITLLGLTAIIYSCSTAEHACPVSERSCHAKNLHIQVSIVSFTVERKDTSRVEFWRKNTDDRHLLYRPSVVRSKKGFSHTYYLLGKMILQRNIEVLRETLEQYLLNEILPSKFPPTWP